MTRECHADCNITLLLDPKLAESTKEDGVVRSSDKSRIGRGTVLVCHCGFCVEAGLALAEIAGLGELIEPGVTGIGVENDGGGFEGVVGP